MSLSIWGPTSTRWTNKISKQVSINEKLKRDSERWKLNKVFSSYNFFVDFLVFIKVKYACNSTFKRLRKYKVRTLVSLPIYEISNSLPKGQNYDIFLGIPCISIDI